MPKKALSTQFITNIVTPVNQRKQTYFDTRTKGLVLEVRVSGGKTFYLRYTDDRGKTRYIKLADVKDVTLAQARKLCDQKRNQLAMGIDPLEDKATKRNVPTFAEFATERYLPYAMASKRSWKTDETLIRKHLIPLYGTRHLDEIKPQDVLSLQQKGIQDGAAPGSINRRLILLRSMFNLAWKSWEIAGVTRNPTQGLKLLPENNKKERYVTQSEFNRLYRAAEASPNPMLQYIVAFLIMTGARKNEVLRATWQEFDLMDREWHIHETKSGLARRVPLNDGALAILNVVKGLSRSEYVFGNPKTGQHFTHVWNSWNSARKKAGLPNVRLHDLRHTFASLLINNGRSLYEVQKLLGHTQVKSNHPARAAGYQVPSSR